MKGADADLGQTAAHCMAAAHRMAGVPPSGEIGVEHRIKLRGSYFLYIHMAVRRCHARNNFQGFNSLQRQCRGNDAAMQARCWRRWARGAYAARIALHF